MPSFGFMDCFFELGSNITAYGELNPTEAGVRLPILAPVAIRHKVMLVACGVRAEANGFYLLGKKREGMNKNTELLISCRNIPVSEFCMKDKAQFCPIGIEGLIGFVPLIGEETLLFLCMNKGGIHIEGGALYRIMSVDSGDKIGMDPLKGGKKFRQRRDHRFPFFAGIVLVESGKIPEYGRGGRD
jgi:hypothetical protein